MTELTIVVLGDFAKSDRTYDGHGSWSLRFLMFFRDT